MLDEEGQRARERLGGGRSEEGEGGEETKGRRWRERKMKGKSKRRKWRTAKKKKKEEEKQKERMADPDEWELSKGNICTWLLEGSGKKAIKMRVKRKEERAHRETKRS